MSAGHATLTIQHLDQLLHTPHLCLSYRILIILLRPRHLIKHGRKQHCQTGVTFDIFLESLKGGMDGSRVGLNVRES